MRHVRHALLAWPVVACALVQWLVLARAPFLPFVDLPQHVAQAQLLLHRSDPSVAALYEVRLVPQVNVLGLCILAPLQALFSEGVAGRGALLVFLGRLAPCFGGFSARVATA